MQLQLQQTSFNSGNPGFLWNGFNRRQRTAQFEVTIIYTKRTNKMALLRIRRVDVYRFSMTLTLKFAFRKYFIKWTKNIFRHSGHLRVENNNINFERAPSKYPKIRLVATVENLYSTQYTIKWFVPKIVAGFPSEQKFRVFFYLFIYLFDHK